MEERSSYNNLWNYFKPLKQMVFISGPRQAGKTTFSKLISATFPNSIYVNWDIIENKRKFTDDPLFYEKINRKDFSKPLVILDEIHKFPSWKDYLKGAYDRDGENFKFLITGSGRLDLYQKGSDSLAGRYFLFHLWPFTLAELGKQSMPFDNFINDPLKARVSDSAPLLTIWDGLLKCSGFPDPFLKNERQFYNIWSETYRKQLIREDVRDLAAIIKVEQAELLYSILINRIGSTLSLNNLAHNINVSFDTVKSWLRVFDNYFLTFRLSSWSKKISRAILREKKSYLFDFGCIPDPSALFENAVALELKRAVTSWTETGRGSYGLYFVRNKEKQEVDFLITQNDKPFLLIECKESETKVSPSLIKIQNQLKVGAIQLVNRPNFLREVSNDNQKIVVTSAVDWLGTLP